MQWFGQPLASDAVLNKQHDFQTRTPQFSQRIISTLDIAEDEAGQVWVEFVKQAGTDGKQVKNYPAQLMFKKRRAAGASAVKRIYSPG